MKLNPDCIRDILLEVENTCDYENELNFDEDNVPTSLKQYKYGELIYHVKQCQMNNFFEDCKISIYQEIYISYLSPAGHTFLENVRSDNLWNKTKNIGKKIGSTSLDALIKISSNVITEIIKAEIGLCR